MIQRPYTDIFCYSVPPLLHRKRIQGKRSSNKPETSVLTSQIITFVSPATRVVKLETFAKDRLVFY